MTQRPLLAAVIVLDQFSRNLFRGTPRAFAADPIARQLSRAAVKQRFDEAMNEQERLFLYMPFEHSEDRKDQAIAVELIARLGNEEWTRDAIAHKTIIDQLAAFRIVTQYSTDFRRRTRLRFCSNRGMGSDRAVHDQIKPTRSVLRVRTAPANSVEL